MNSLSQQFFTIFFRFLPTYVSFVILYMLKSLLQLYPNWFKCGLVWIAYIWFMFAFKPFFKRKKKETIQPMEEEKFTIDTITYCCEFQDSGCFDESILVLEEMFHWLKWNRIWQNDKLLIPENVEFSLKNCWAYQSTIIITRNEQQQRATTTNSALKRMSYKAASYIFSQVTFDVRKPNRLNVTNTWNKNKNNEFLFECLNLRFVSHSSFALCVPLEDEKLCERDKRQKMLAEWNIRVSHFFFFLPFVFRLWCGVNVCPMYQQLI